MSVNRESNLVGETMVADRVTEATGHSSSFMIGTFLKALYSLMAPGEDIELRAIVRGGAGTEGARVRTYFSHRPDDLIAWAQSAMPLADVYIGAAPRVNRDGTANGVRRILNVWGDFDFKGAHTEETRTKQIEGMACLPTVIVRSGGGFHLYWRLETPAVSAEQLERAVRLMRGLAEKYGCDNVGDLPHVMRIPCTLNHKYDPPRPVVLAGAHRGNVFSLDELEAMVGDGRQTTDDGRRVGGGRQTTDDGRQLGEERGLLSGVSASSALSTTTTPSSVVHPLSSTHTGGSPPTSSSVVGRPPSALDTASALQGVPEGERDVTLFRLACKLRRAGVPQIVAARLIKEAAENCVPPFPWKEALLKVVRVYARYPEGRDEEYIMRETERERIDPTLRGFAGDGSASTQGAELFEMSGDELQASAAAGGGAEPPSLPFLQQKGYIVEGWSHVIAGYPRCGKTELLARLCREWLDAGKSIVYFSEESQKVWEHRLARLGKEGGDWSRMRVVFALSTAIDKLFTRAYGGEEDVVVIDTMRNLLQLVDETDNSRIAAVLNPWVAGARLHNKTLIMAHHMRKGGGDHGEGIAGGHALMGVFDIALTLRKEDRAPTRRLVTAYARLLQPPELIYEQEADGTMRAKGDPASVQLAEVVERVKAVLGEEWEKTSEVRDALGEPHPSQEQLRLVLLQLAKQGEIERDPPLPEEAKGRTIMWRRPMTT